MIKTYVLKIEQKIRYFYETAIILGTGVIESIKGAVRDDGLTKQYVPAMYPAVPSFKLMALAHKYAPDAVYGIIRSHDGFYMDDNAETEAYWSSKGIVVQVLEAIFNQVVEIDQMMG